MGKIFNYDGPVFSFLSRVADLLWLNTLFIICCIPIFTIGAATSAMYYVTLKMVRNEESYITKSFFKSFRQNFKQGTGIWLIIFIILAVLVFDLRILAGGLSYDAIFNNQTMNNVVLVLIVAMDVLVLFVWIYVFPLLAKFDNTVKNMIKNAFFMSIRHLPQTFLIIAMYVIPLLLLYFFPQAFIGILIVFAVEAYLASFLFVKIFDKYLPKEEEVIEGENDGQVQGEE